MRERLTAREGFLLRPWEPDDASALVIAFGTEEMRWQTPGDPIDTPEAARAWIGKRIEARQQDTGYAFAVTDPEGTVVGNVAVTAINRTHDIGWVSYWTTESARGRGVAGAATRTIAAWALTELGLFRLELGHRTNNAASCRVALAAGFAVEGLERQKLRYGDTRYDVETHARLATDPTP